MPVMEAMHQRLSINDVDPDAYKAVLGLEKYVHAGGLDDGLLALVKSRASQINHCASSNASSTCWRHGGRRATCSRHRSAPRSRSPSR